MPPQVGDHAVYPHEPQKQWDAARATLAKLAVTHRVDLIAIGNGTASRETDKLATDLVKLLPDLKMSKIVVSEAGASVYSASAFASEELPELDVTLRGAVSIARRLQDPLAELVKIDPKAIGVGQYQHDLSEIKLARSLDAVVELRQRGRRRCQCSVCAALAGVARRTLRKTSYLSDVNIEIAEAPVRGSGQRRSSNAPASCALMTARTRSMPPACTQRPIRWCGGFLPPPKATSRR
jgi:uncharacterized protein